MQPRAKLFGFNSFDDGSQTKRAILDTNVMYPALHNPAGVCGRIVLLGTGPLAELYSIDLAREELRINLERKKLGFVQDDAKFIISGLPIRWMPKEVYSRDLTRAMKSVKIPQDAAFLAASLATGIAMVTGDSHLQTEKARRLINIYKPRDFLELLAPGHRRPQSRCSHED